MKRLLSSALIGSLVLGLSAQDPNRALRPQQAMVQPAVQEARVALVIGNGAYGEAPLRNPVNDARAMKDALESCKFTVTLLTNASKREMEDAIRAFGDTIRGGAVGLFYFAGHGVQVKGVNYLVPVGARMDREVEVPYQAVDAGQVLDMMDAAKNKLNILILDACRNNPFARSWRSSGDRGLAQVKAPTGSLIAYATSPGSTAADGTGDHGLYTEALLTLMKEPGLELEKVFKRVREKVLDGSGQQQTPWESNSTVGDFYFRPLTTQGLGPTVAQIEATYWEGIKDSRDPKDFDAFLTRFPDGTFRELAKVKLSMLKRASSKTWRPKTSFDGRVGFVLVDNPLTIALQIRFFHPDSTDTAPFVQLTVPAHSKQAVTFNGKPFGAGNDWGVQIGPPTMPILNLSDVAEGSQRTWTVTPDRFNTP